MRASLEISLYPLQETYKKTIIGFIDQIKKNQALEVRVNSMSTQIFGEYSDIVKMLDNELKQVMDSIPTAIAVMKLVNADLED